MLTFALDPTDARVYVDDTASNMDYFCPTCGSPVIPRKGEVRRHHFAHKGGGSCADGWSRSYDDSEWHHLWQERFPRENQEITLALGEVRHRADVLIETTVVEYQRNHPHAGAVQRTQHVLPGPGLQGRLALRPP